MRASRKQYFKGSVAVATLLSVALAGCGGGGDSGGDATASSSPATQTPVDTPVAQPGAPAGNAPAGNAPLGTPGATPAGAPKNTLALACEGCSPSVALSYSGSGVGIWRAKNDTASSADVPVQIAGLTGQDLTLVFTNTTGSELTMQGISLTAGSSSSMRQSMRRGRDADARVHGGHDEQIMEFNRTGWQQYARQGAAPRFSVVAPVQWAVNDTRNWYSADGTTRAATLVRQATASDGVTVNYWVETAESTPQKVSSAHLDALVAGFSNAGGIYDMLKSVGGPLWGPHQYGSSMIASEGQPVDIVILNFDRNAQPYGKLGYFWSQNAFLKTSRPDSNESVSLYLDAETLYLGGEPGREDILLAMAHEGMHLQNFYRRSVLAGGQYGFNVWLEEMTAMMMEDFASLRVNDGYNNIRDNRFIDYIGYKGGNLNCNLLRFTGFGTNCESYSVSGSLGGFLNRQLGLDFYKDLLSRTSHADSVAVLDAAIRNAKPASSLADEVLRWSTTSGSLMPAAGSPAGYGYPARTDGGFTLPVIDPSLYTGIRTLATAVPDMLQPYATFPVVRQAVRGTYNETVKLPAGMTLTVVVH
ncbi:M30 family zinc metallopeptidase [Cupriavidus pinatubonensis]|uniref:Hemagglutinin-related transmembrane protein n=1 Tax=Cupriavidus pinatubonensis TaxID=248026 RepID=A0ABM8XFU5_9BURK|nr:hemagglutinin [Cupriavidus pinatubonensis]CAG9178813.1 hypothetical protein LMG23994_04009 [Cupriavidus pinatubonensis]